MIYFLVQLFLLFGSINCMKQGPSIPFLNLNDGNKLPTMAFGTYLLKGEVARQSIVRAVEAGLRLIDTAAYYENEVDVGAAVAEVIDRKIVTREEIFISTKLWNKYHDREQVVPQLKKSLERLGLDYVDMFLIHTPMAESENGTFLCTDYLETWRGMEDAKKLGLTKSIGVSNFNSRQINRILVYGSIVPAVNQIEGNPTFPNIPLVAYCQQRGIVVMTYSPLGFLVPRGRGRDEQIGPTINNPVLVEIAQKYGKTVIQVVLRYEIDRWTIPISNTRNPKHLEENVNIFDFNLTDTDIERINEFDRKAKVYTLANYRTHLYYGIYTP
ncbi:aldo-keto reductase AKR2E4-like [Zerene cesonia]|uniref:aldo-keto reductase AKR2E4-like n=1 Tax=Zerene cesonia TaxID=33412 RepID=UPI0018E5096B|nr:aldo-keto reductase AKR2E4-like [Zerene cesonia]